MRSRLTRRILEGGSVGCSAGRGEGGNERRHVRRNWVVESLLLVKHVRVEHGDVGALLLELDLDLVDVVAKLNLRSELRLPAE